MKNILFGVTTSMLITATTFSNTNNIINLNSKYKNKKTHVAWSREFAPECIVENWYKFLATNDWKLLISRDKWENTFLNWFGDALVGRISPQSLLNNIYHEIKSWKNHGNRNFDNSEYWSLVNYIFKYHHYIGRIFYQNPRLNRIGFKTDSDERMVGFFDASV